MKAEEIRKNVMDIKARQGLTRPQKSSMMICLEALEEMGRLLDYIKRERVKLDTGNNAVAIGKDDALESIEERIETWMEGEKETWID